MSKLQTVSFRNPVTPEPRLSKPYVPGRHSKRYWTEAELDIIRKHYPSGGVAACQPRLQAHRTPSGIYAQANKMELRCAAKKRVQRYPVTPEMDAAIREAWAQIDGRKRGEVTELADRLGVPRWWLSKRAAALGLTMPRSKEPRWTEAENDLMRHVPLHDCDRCAKIFRQHGFKRSATAIMVRAKRLALSRRAARKTLSATGAGNLLGVDIKTITRLIIAGDLPAVKRDDKRLAQQGGSAWDIEKADLKAYIVDHLEAIDLRKVEKFAFVDLIAGPGQ